ncbi:N-acetyltransferase [Bradyrhizobium sp. WSM1743]|uniref:GNAT family N-acetyltransferase n=1 Tax=Bradyrhizobium sp. WSM1743 TaxID=318996 RepID=UPI000480384A|nr:GNAT family N-acetyltransferase [Bradyrhizobium sp. WSM1743]
MQLLPLAPDLSFPPLGRSPDDLLFSFRVKQAAIGPYVTQKWGWDEDYQFAVHQRHFEEKPFFAIERGRARIGTISVQQIGHHIRFGEFYILPSDQRAGPGTRILAHCLDAADSLSLPVQLEYLKWNPVGSLYKRHGFVVTGETEIHWLMERPAHGFGY